MRVLAVARCFDDVVARHADRLAIADGTTRLTYRQLGDEVERLTHAFASAGGEPTRPVALVLPHGAPLAAGLLAGLALGRPCVPIEPSMPAARRQQILDDAGATLLVTTDGAMPLDAPPPASHPAVTAPDVIALLLYTSGSTGAPKGVVYTQQRLVERIVRHDRFGVGPGDRLGIFGAAGMSVFRALLSGAALVSWDIARDGVAGVGAWIAREQLTMLHGIPTLFRRLARVLDGAQRFPHLRCVSVTGEPLVRRDAADLRRLFPSPCVLVNGLGTTEAGTFCQGTIEADADANASRDGAGELVPVGFAVDGTEVLLLDASGAAVAPGDTGEIVVRGELLSAGYWRQPALEAERFAPDPVRPGARRYRTGDLGRLLPNGALVHLGRRDQQLKIRGVRVEPTEVEAVLRAHPEVLEAAAIGHEIEPGDVRLIACVAVRKRRPECATELARFVRERLPSAMVPEGWTFVDALPATPNGKVDRRALPLPLLRTARPAFGIVDRFARQVARQGPACAFRLGDQVLTFAELDRRSAALAARLRAAGVGHERVVAIAVERAPISAVCVLAVLRAGGACLPLDPHGPPQRNAAALRESGARWLLARDGGALDTAPDVVRLEPDMPSGDDAGLLPTRFDPDRLAFVLYTSGSTGRPKGVELTEGQVLHRLLWDWTARPAAAGEVSCQRGATGFVDAIAEWLGPLLHGVPTEIVSDELLRRPRLLVDALARAQVTRILLVPSQLELLLDTVEHIGAKLPALRLWTASGEALGRATVERFRRALPGRELWNVYGATEAWDATCHRLDGDDAVVPIGRPLPGMRAYVLDDAMAPVAIGGAGDLYLAGVGLARGYRGDAALTDEKFVPNPFTPGVSDRLYRTGDRARRRDDGLLEHLGRTDRQVKVLGVRIELGEVEAVLASHPGVREAAAVAVGRRIVAHVAPEPGRTIDVDALRAHARDRLAPSAAPREIVVHAALPRNDRGKLDRAALVVIPSPRPRPDDLPSHVEPAFASELEATLTQVFVDLLGRDAVAPDDDFFDLGGDSLLAVQLVAEIEALIGRTVPLDAIAARPTPRAIAAALTRSGFDWATDGCIAPYADARGPALFGVCGAWGYAVRLLRVGRALGAEFPLHALQPPGMVWPAGYGLRDMAAHYVAEIRRRQPSGPYRLLGTSFGGVIVFEIALQLEAAGREVAFVAMIDSALPSKPLRVPDEFDMSHLSPIEQAGHRMFAAHARASIDYVPATTLAGRCIYFLCGESAHQHHVGWQALMRRPIEIVPVPGRHGEFHVEPQLGAVVEHLQALRRQAPAPGPTPQVDPAPPYGATASLVERLFRGAARVGRRLLAGSSATPGRQ